MEFDRQFHGVFMRKPLAVLPFGEEAETAEVVRIDLRDSIAKGDLTAAELKKRGYEGI